MSLYIGYDVGSISVNRAVVDDKGKVISVLPYTRHLGDPVKLVADDLKSLIMINTAKRSPVYVLPVQEQKTWQPIWR